ncbi:GIY-YIG nuclease family protein [Candidatus Roizmanbacteria bacterium]|nr:MAG: GIY-YIG nuclease family protein [Candidatus Roizmanbacteria bacterium]
MFYYTYVLESTINGTLYIGWTTDLVHRIEEHNNKNVTSTKRYVPWVVVYYEACRSKKGAIEREKQLKTGFGRAYLKRRLSK